MTATDEARAACVAAIKAVDASLSVLVIARENIVNAMRAIVEEEEGPAREAPIGSGHEPDPECGHPDESRMDLPGGAQLCDDCGVQVR